MKIVMVTNEFPPSIGGVQTHVDELSRAMASLGHEVHVITRHKDPAVPSAEVRGGVRVHRCKLSDSHWLYDWQLKRALKALHRESPIDIIHVHGMRPLAGAGKVGLPVVFTNHTSSYLRRIQEGEKVRLKMLKQLQVASLVLAPSEELADATRATGYRGPVIFIANGVDVEKFSPGPSNLRQQLRIPENAFVLVLARRLVEKNGVLYFARAIAGIDHPDLHVVVAGDGSERAAFTDIIEGSPIASRVHMLGGVANTAMPDIFRGANASVLPSLMEATSIAGLEAMACGLPLIGTRVGGIPVIVREGETGLLVEPRSPEQLQQAIQRMLNDREQAKRMGQKSLELTRSEFSWKIIAAKTIDQYRQAGAQGS